MIRRVSYLKRLETAVRRSKITAILGPRQSGKTTLARMFDDKRLTNYFDLENIRDRNRLQNPQLVLEALQGLIVIDEIQILPELFALLRVLVDRPRSRSRFLILGSASPEIIRNASETLAGRIEFIELSGFALHELIPEDSMKLWLRGGFPPSFLATSEEDSTAWREGFIQTFLARDIPQLGISIPAAAMRRFWTMLAHYHGQVWNASELARSLAVSDKTVRSYLDLLTGTFMVRQLQPWYENVGKRQVKAAKIYLRDSGILHSLLDLPDLQSLYSYPKAGASWEGFALEQTLQTLRPSQAYFWATHSGAELDLFFLARGRRIGIECKFSETPGMTRSMEAALDTLRLHHLYIVYPGLQSFSLSEKISAQSIQDLPALQRTLFRHKEFSALQK